MPNLDNKHLYEARISLDRLRRNYLTLASLGGEEHEVISVIKSNAYGHGIEEVARCLYDLGARKFAVSTLDEAITAHNSLGKGHSAEILIFGYTPPALAGEILERPFIQAIGSLSYAEALRASAAAPIKAHIKLDTGMHRLGIYVKDGEVGLEEISGILPMHSVSGIYSHLHSADGFDSVSREATLAQISRFARAASTLPDGITRHILNSAGALRYYNDTPEDSRHTIRPGIALYGASPSPDIILPEGFSPVLSLYTIIAEIKDICPGESIGYGGSYIAEEKMRIAILPIGYGEGYKRSLSSVGKVVINDTICPIVGRICMNMMAVDITELASAKVGDAVTLIGDSLSASELGAASGTIAYDILTSIGSIIKRTYI